MYEAGFFASSVCLSAAASRRRLVRADASLWATPDLSNDPDGEATTASTPSAGTKLSKTPGKGQTKPNILVIWGEPELPQ